MKFFSSNSLETLDVAFDAFLLLRQFDHEFDLPGSLKFILTFEIKSKKSSGLVNECKHFNASFVF